MPVRPGVDGLGAGGWPGPGPGVGGWLKNGVKGWLKLGTGTWLVPAGTLRT
jgi:hypothetical protein